MPLLSELSDFKGRLQGELFPQLEVALGPLTEKMKKLVAALEMV